MSSTLGTETRRTCNLGSFVIDEVLLIRLSFGEVRYGATGCVVCFALVVASTGSWMSEARFDRTSVGLTVRAPSPPKCGYAESRRDRGDDGSSWALRDVDLK